MRSATITKRFAAFAFGVIALAVMWTFADTNLVWRWMRRPNETYPEFAYLLIGVPAAIVAVSAGLLIALKASPSHRANWLLITAYVVNGIALAVCALLSIAAVLPLLT